MALGQYIIRWNEAYNVGSWSLSVNKCTMPAQFALASYKLKSQTTHVCNVKMFAQGAFTTLLKWELGRAM